MKHPFGTPSDEVFCEIDADEFERAKRDPRIREFARRADEYLASLRRIGEEEGDA